MVNVYRETGPRVLAEELDRVVSELERLAAPRYESRQLEREALPTPPNESSRPEDSEVPLLLETWCPDCGRRAVWTGKLSETGGQLSFHVGCTACPESFWTGDDAWERKHRARRPSRLTRSPERIRPLQKVVADAHPGCQSCKEGDLAPVIVLYECGQGSFQRGHVVIGRCGACGRAQVEIHDRDTFDPEFHEFHYRYFVLQKDDVSRLLELADRCPEPRGPPAHAPSTTPCACRVRSWQAFESGYFCHRIPIPRHRPGRY